MAALQDYGRRLLPSFCVSTIFSGGDVTASPGLCCSGKGGVEVLQHSHEVLALAWAPSGKMLASATLDGQIYLWDPLEEELQVLSASSVTCPT